MAFPTHSGDGKVGRDNCLRGGVGVFNGITCLGLGTFKGHTPTDMQNANYGTYSLILIVHLNLIAMVLRPSVLSLILCCPLHHLSTALHHLCTAGMPSPHGYRTALRLMKLAEKFHLPVVRTHTVFLFAALHMERRASSLHSYLP